MVIELGLLQFGLHSKQVKIILNKDCEFEFEVNEENEE